CERDAGCDEAIFDRRSPGLIGQKTQNSALQLCLRWVVMPSTSQSYTDVDLRVSKRDTANLCESCRPSEKRGFIIGDIIRWQSRPRWLAITSDRVPDAVRHLKAM